MGSSRRVPESRRNGAMIPTIPSHQHRTVAIIRDTDPLIEKHLGVVPEATSEWYLKSRRQAELRHKKEGKSFPGMIGPPPWMIPLRQASEIGATTPDHEGSQRTIFIMNSGKSLGHIQQPDRKYRARNP